MTFLPIIGRELRVRARSRAAYWARFAVALVAALLCLPKLISSGPFGTPATMGGVLFNEMLSVAFLFSCGACLLTADVISSERREGTLGLLLLTRVSTFDVLLGKLSSAGLTSLCALLACLPMLMIPLLAGGVTGSEVFRKGLVMVDTLFLALAAGVWASARGHEWLKNRRTAVLVVVTLVVAPSLAGPAMRGLGALGPDISLLSPLGTVSAAGDAMYRASPGSYWTSLILVHAVGWTLVISAGFRLRSGWREERGEATVPVPGRAQPGATEPDGPWLSCSWTLPVPESAAGAVPEATAPRSSPLGDDANPIAWLLQRQRGTRAILWAGALLGLAYHGFLYLAGRFVGPGAYSSLVWPLSLATSTLGSALFAWAASRFFVEARRTGELELLLTTPLGAKQIVSTQWQVLRRLLRWPMLVLLSPVFLQAAYVIAMSLTGSMGSPYWGLPFALTSLLNCVTMLLEVGALCWVGLWFGLRTGSQAQAIVWTVSVVKVLPYLFFILYQVLFFAVANPLSGPWRPPYWIISSLPQVVGLLFYLVMVRLARQRLLGELVDAHAVTVDWRQALSSAARGALAAIRKARHWTPS